MISKPFTLEEFEYIYSRVPRLCVEVLVKTDDGVILTKRSIPPWIGMWHIPGGTVLYKETLEQAVKRIADLELGVEVSVDTFLGFIYYPSEENERGYGWSVGAAYICTIIRGTPRGSEQGEEVLAFKSLPENTVIEQRDFISLHKLL